MGGDENVDNLKIIAVGFQNSKWLRQSDTFDKFRRSFSWISLYTVPYPNQLDRQLRRLWHHGNSFQA